MGASSSLGPGDRAVEGAGDAVPGLVAAGLHVVSGIVAGQTNLLQLRLGLVDCAFILSISAFPSSDPAEAIIEERAVSERLTAIRSGDGGGRRPFSGLQAGRDDERRNAEQCCPPDRLSSREGAGRERTFRDCPGHSALSVEPHETTPSKRASIGKARAEETPPEKPVGSRPGSAAAPGRRGPRAGRGARDGTLTGTAQGARRWHGNRPWTDHRQARSTHHCLLTL
jgi:hypothetical protein